MPSRTVKGSHFAIVVDGKRIVVKHLYAKGKRCRVIAPKGVVIESCAELDETLADSTDDDFEVSNGSFVQVGEPLGDQ